MKYYLIGMPGSGKSTIGALLAKKLKIKFIDLDGLIEREALAFIDDIFLHLGEKTFRELETKALASIQEENAVIACGGGVIVTPKNKSLMDGVVIYLDTDIEIIRKRLETDYQRPLLKEKNLDDLYDERFIKYQHFATCNINNNMGSEYTIDQILNYLKQEGLL